MTADGHRRLRGEDGFALVELLAAIGVSAVVLAFIMGTVVDALRAQRRQTTQVAALNDARLAFERATNDIRAANPLRQVASDRVELDVRDGSAAVRTVRYERIGQGLVFTNVTTGTSRTLVSGLATQPLFVFHLSDGSTAPGDAAVDASVVRSVTVRLRVAPTSVGRVVDLENRVLVRNARS